MNKINTTGVQQFTDAMDEKIFILLSDPTYKYKQHVTTLRCILEGRVISDQPDPGFLPFLEDNDLLPPFELIPIPVRGTTFFKKLVDSALRKYPGRFSELLMMAANQSDGFASYYYNPLQSKSIFVYNVSSLGEHGTTGLRTWNAALVLGQYLVTFCPIGPTDTVLELGCGTGFVSMVIGKFLPHASVVATDISQKVVDLANKMFDINRLPTCKASLADFTGLIDKSYVPSVIVASDIIVDPNDFSSLSNNLREYLNLGTSRILIALEVRNRNTFCTLISKLTEYGLCVCDFTCYSERSFAPAPAPTSGWYEDVFLIYQHMPDDLVVYILSVGLKDDRGYTNSSDTVLSHLSLH